MPSSLEEILAKQREYIEEYHRYLSLLERRNIFSQGLAASLLVVAATSHLTEWPFWAKGILTLPVVAYHSYLWNRMK
jgi:hypothetical protein